MTIFHKDPILQVLSQQRLPDSDSVVRKQPSLFDI